MIYTYVSNTKTQLQWVSRHIYVFRGLLFLLDCTRLFVLLIKCRFGISYSCKNIDFLTETFFGIKFNFVVFSSNEIPSTECLKFPNNFLIIYKWRHFSFCPKIAFFQRWIAQFRSLKYSYLFHILFIWLASTV